MVVGGCILGCSIAIHPIDLGVRPVLIDPDRPGQGASSGSFASVSAGWEDPQDEALTMSWVRQFYRDVFADTGGVPVPGEGSSGALINHPDVDLAALSQWPGDVEVLVVDDGSTDQTFAGRCLTVARWAAMGAYDLPDRAVAEL